MNPHKWRMALGVAMMFLFATIPGLAQTDPKTKNCLNTAMTQTALNACASEDAARSEAELKRVYRKLLVAAAGQPQALKKIKAAERSWLIYRDAYMEAMFPAKDKLAAYGSIYPMNADFARSSLTENHMRALKTMLLQYEGKLNTGS